MVVDLRAAEYMLRGLSEKAIIARGRQQRLARRRRLRPSGAMCGDHGDCRGIGFPRGRPVQLIREGTGRAAEEQ